jgi:uncharacterized metal-binding protein YceD (DUF177 family)
MKKQTVCTINMNDLTAAADSMRRIALDDTFFERFEYAELLGGNIVADIRLHRSHAAPALQITLQGTVKVQCDRCLEPFDIAVRSENVASVIYASGEDFADDADCEAVFADDCNNIDLAQYIYESVCLSLPIQRFHPADGDGGSGCNPQMIAKLKECNWDNRQID